MIAATTRRPNTKQGGKDQPNCTVSNCWKYGVNNFSLPITNVWKSHICPTPSASCYLFLTIGALYQLVRSSTLPGTPHYASGGTRHSLIWASKCMHAPDHHRQPRKDRRKTYFFSFFLSCYFDAWVAAKKHGCPAQNLCRGWWVIKINLGCK